MINLIQFLYVASFIFPSKILHTFNFQSVLEYEISSKAASLYFPDENITIQIPPNSLPAHVAPCRASVSPEECQGSHQRNAMSKIYEFNPSGLTIQNNIMFVIPLFDSHQYEYDNMTLMYQQDRHCQFVDADDMKVHKPTWLFYGNKCYIFVNHFCKMYVSKKKNISGRKVKSITLESLLFYKQDGKNLELVTTFGCHNKKSVCSTKKVEQVWNFNIVKIKPISFIICNVSCGSFQLLTYYSLSLFVCYICLTLTHSM